MSHSSRSRKLGSASLVAVAFLLISVTGAAQTPPPPPKSDIPEPTPIYPQMKGREITLGEGTWIRFGLQTQTWLDILQSSVPNADGSDEDYAFNIYERRLRLFAGVQAFRRLQIFVLIERSTFPEALVRQERDQSDHVCGSGSVLLT